MTAYRLFGAETSPYSLKVRSFLRYKGADFDWVLRSAATEEEFQKYAPLPTLPLLIAPDGKASQDSTNMLAQLEKEHAEPSAEPEDKACYAISLLLEDYADEWLNKAMFLNRWSQSPDKEAAATRVLEQLFSGRAPARKRDAQASVIKRMNERLPLVGASPENAPVITASFQRFAKLLNAHLEHHLFIFGGRPSSADFAIAGQLQQMLLDPTTNTLLNEQTPFLVSWCEFMESPAAGAPFASLDDLSETLLPLMRDEVCATYLPWAAANSAAITKRRKEVSLELADGAFAQATQRYTAKSYRTVVKALEKLDDADGLAAFLDACGAKPYL